MTQLLKKGLEEKSMAPTEETPPESPPPAVPKEKIGDAEKDGEFLLDNRICEVWNVHGSDIKLTTGEVLERGKKIKARMNRESGEFFFLNNRDIPLKYSQYTFVFPEWVNKEGEKKKDGFIRIVDQGGVTWWCLIKCPEGGDCDSRYRVIRYRYLPLALPPPPNH